MKKHKIYVIYGQGGKGPLSFGFILFKNRLTSMGYNVKDDILWKYPNEIASDMNAQSSDTIIIALGYSLGANCLTWIPYPGYGLKRDIDLICGYDPSWFSMIKPIGSNVKKALCYRCYGLNPFGHAQYEGPQVEYVNTISDHLLVCYDPQLHNRTIQEIQKLV